MVFFLGRDSYALITSITSNTFSSRFDTFQFYTCLSFQECSREQVLCSQKKQLCLQNHTSRFHLVFVPPNFGVARIPHPSRYLFYYVVLGFYVCFLNSIMSVLGSKCIVYTIYMAALYIMKSLQVVRQYFILFILGFDHVNVCVLLVGRLVVIN